MAVITKTMANEIAEAMLKSGKENILTLEEDFKSSFFGMVYASTPTLIIDAFAEHPNVFKTRSSIYISSYGLVGRFNLPKRWPDIPFVIKAEQAMTLSMRSNIIIDTEQNYDKLYLDITVALLALRTFKRVREEFPEAAVFLKENISTALVVNIQDLKNRLNGN